MNREYPAASYGFDGPRHTNAQGLTILYKVSYVPDSRTAHVNSVSILSDVVVFTIVKYQSLMLYRRWPKSYMDLFDACCQTKAQGQPTEILVNLELAVTLTLCRSNAPSVTVRHLYRVSSSMFASIQWRSTTKI